MTPTKRYGKATKRAFMVRLSPEENKKVIQQISKTGLTRRQWLLKKLGLK